MAKWRACQLLHPSIHLSIMAKLTIADSVVGSSRFSKCAERVMFFMSEKKSQANETISQSQKTKSGKSWKSSLLVIETVG
jgi:hypothetical protein